jgi:hypothetical protein
LIRLLALALAGGLIALLSACTSAAPREGLESKRAVVIVGVVMRNELAYPVTDVMIEVPATGSFAGCGTVLPRAECRNTFQEVDYRGDAVVVRWRERGELHQTDEFSINPSAGTRPGEVFSVEVVVFAPGQAGARLVEATPGVVRNR